MKIAMVSEHASPLARLGEVDAGGQNVHVAALSTALAERGHQVVVYTRRDARTCRTGCRWPPACRSSTSRPARPGRCQGWLLPYMDVLRRPAVPALAAVAARHRARALLDERPGRAVGRRRAGGLGDDPTVR